MVGNGRGARWDRGGVNTSRNIPARGVGALGCIAVGAATEETKHNRRPRAGGKGLKMQAVKDPGADLAGLGAILLVNDQTAGIWETNYFHTPNSAAGLVFCSFWRDCFRLLVPASLAGDVQEMMTGNYCVVTRGRSDISGRMMYEFMFEDNSSSPFCCVIEEAAFLGGVPGAGALCRSDLSLSIWLEDPSDKNHPTAGGSMLARFRASDRVPYLKPWPAGGADDGAENHQL